MNTVLRGRFNFTGMVVSDCGAVGDGAFSSYIKVHFGGDPKQQARLGVQAGCDLNVSHVASRAMAMSECMVDSS